MKNIILVIIELVFGINNLYSQWIQTDGPYGNSDVRVAFEYDSSYFTSTYLCGFFSKSSTENSWNLNSDIYFKTYTIKGDSLFTDAHYFAGGMSRNMGVQLFDLNNPEAIPISINTITSKALNHSDTCLFGGNETDGFFKLSFDGSVLEYYNNGLPTDTIWTPWGTHYETNVTAIELTNDYIFSGTDKGVYRSDAYLNNWEEINNGLLIGNVTFIESLQDTLYTSIDQNLYYSFDNGNNWSLIYSATSNITSFQKENSQMFISTTNNGVYYSIDNGINWSTMNSGLTDSSVNFISKLDSLFFCGTKTNGIFKFQGSSWSNDNSGMVCSMIGGITSTNNTLISNDRMNIYKYSNNYSWEKINIPEIIIYPNLSAGIGSVETLGDTIFNSYGYSMPEWPYNNIFIKYSTNYGETWGDFLSIVAYEPDEPYKLYIKGNTIYRYEGDKMFYTTDFGINWFEISIPPEYCNMFYDFIVYNNTPYAAACGNGQLLRLNSDDNWELTNNGLPIDREPEDLAFCDNALFTYISIHGMYVSFDNGNNWSYASNGLDTEWGIRDFAHYGQHLFVSTENGIFATSNYGQNWYECNDGLKNLNTSSLKILNDTLYAGTFGNGIWKRAIENINLSISEQQYSSFGFEIFPNPATDYLSIELSLDNNGEIQIFDIMGRKILSKSIETNEKISISNIPNGTYLVILKTSKNIKTKKLIINR
jgi:hypothetical protein